MIKKILILLIGIGIVTVIFGDIYGTVQQSYRQGANDPQIQMAEDAATLLWYGHTPTEVLPSNIPIDMSLTLSPFMIITDDTGYILSTSGYLAGAVPLPPKGVFDYARTHGEDRITWQPRNDVRIATIITRYGNATSSTSGFVIVGRSLREVEMRESKLTFMVGIGWILSIIGLIILFVISLF